MFIGEYCRPIKFRSLLFVYAELHKGSKGDATLDTQSPDFLYRRMTELEFASSEIPRFKFRFSSPVLDYWSFGFLTNGI